MKTKSASAAYECLENTIQNFSEALCELAISHCETSMILIRAALPDGPERNSMLEHFDQMKENTTAAMIAFKKIADDADASQGTWFERMLKGCSTKQ